MENIMVTIIKQGSLPEDRLFETTCSHCGTIFTFQRKEADYRSDQRDGEYLIISCPYCNRSVYNYI